MERFGKIVIGWKLLTIFAKCSILDVSQGSEYAFEERQWNRKQSNIILVDRCRFLWKLAKAITPGFLKIPGFYVSSKTLELYLRWYYALLVAACLKHNPNKTVLEMFTKFKQQLFSKTPPNDYFLVVVKTYVRNLIKYWSGFFWMKVSSYNFLNVCKSSLLKITVHRSMSTLGS